MHRVTLVPKDMLGAILDDTNFCCCDSIRNERTSITNLSRILKGSY